MKKKAFSFLLAVVIFCSGYYVGQNTPANHSTASQTPTSQAATSTPRRAYSGDIIGSGSNSVNPRGTVERPKPSYTTPTANPFSSSYDPTVYVTDTGSKYHSAGCSYLKSKHEIRLSTAISMGYSPCSRCDPPR